MGGLAGIIHYRGEPPDLSLLQRMSARLAHRGPDAEGRFAEGPVALAHRSRVVSPTRARQPLVTDDLVLLLDGWVFDPEDVARAAGRRGELKSDTEALLAAWQRWTFELMDHLEGAFAAALYNRRSQTLTLFRDRLGTAPLFYAHDGPRFAFASELPALLEVPWVGRTLAREHLAEYLSFRLVHAPRTLVRGVHQVEPAHWLRLTESGVQTRRYWRPDYAAPGTARPKEAEIIPRLQEAVDHAVRRRLRGVDEPGLFLSGGLGSTVIAASARRLDRPMPTFTVAYDDDPTPEAPFAGRVARLLGLEHHDIPVGSATLAELFPRTIQALGHPLGNPASLVQLALATYAREHVRVSLSGDGAGELFGGGMLVGLARQVRRAQRFARLPGPVRKQATRALSLSRRGRLASTPPDQWGLAAGVGGADHLSEAERKSLLDDPGLVRPEVRAEVLSPFYEGLDTDPINAMLHAYLRSSLADGSLVRADRTAAAAGLDVRFPLLDWEVVGLAASLPGSFKVRRGASVHTRWPLQAMLSGVLPRTLVDRPRRGMPTPLEGWLAGPGRLFLESRCARLRTNRLGLWKVASVEELRQSTARHRGTGMKLWTLFILESWLDEYQIT